MNKLIIVGAGASMDFGFPSGIELLQRIYSLWNNPNSDYMAYYLYTMRKFNKRYEYESSSKAAAKQIKYLSQRLYYSSAESIDDFLGQCSDKVDVNFGKLTILDLILNNEYRANTLLEHHGLFKWENNWLRVFFGREFRFENPDILKSKLKEHKIDFIIFNYERSIEHFLFNAISNYYNLAPDKVKEILSNVSFSHVYGMLAPLGWQEDNPNKVLEYGNNLQKDNKLDKLYQCISNIKIVNEDRENLDSIKAHYSQLIKNAQRVCIMGFGFLDSNYKLLGIEEYKKERGKSGIEFSKFFYTSHGLSEGLKDIITNSYFGKYYGEENAKHYDKNIHDYMLNHY